MILEEPTTGKNIEKYGVQEVKTENHYYVVSIVWKNSEKSRMYFPQKGFNVVDYKTNKNLGFISAENAISILKEHASEYDRKDFSWVSFVN